MKALIPLVFAVSLAACGTATESPFLKLMKAAGQNFSQEEAKPSLSEQRASIIEAVRKSGVTSPVLLMELSEHNSVGSMAVAEINGDAVTWFGSGDISVVTRKGVVIATRGLGFDLMAADVAATQAALHGGSASYSKTLRFLDGEGQLQDTSLTCSMTYSGDQAFEECRVGDVSVSNTYLLHKGHVVRSRQWLGEMVGYADLTRLQ